MKSLVLVLGAGLLLTACASYDGGTTDEQNTVAGSLNNFGGSGEVYPEPAASPTFRPGMNPDDPRDPHFRPDPTQINPP